MTTLVQKNDLILITGGPGFIGTYIIELLLKKGYRVRATVRDLKNESNYAHLKAFPHTEGQIEFVEAALDHYDDAIKGVDGVIHTASPYVYTAPDPQKDIVEPAINGVRSMLLAASKSPSVKRVVVTSSGGAIMHFPVSPGYVFSEKDWSTFTVDNHPYFCSKRLAEQAGWDLWKSLKEQNPNVFDFVVVNPLLVLGPSQTSRVNASQEMLIKFFLGQSNAIQPGGPGVTDVRDVAEAHIIALEHPNAVGQRLISYSSTHSWKAIIAEMKKQFPDYPVTPVEVEPESERPNWTMDVSPLQNMGLTTFRKFEDMLHDMIESWIQHGVVPNLRKA